VLGTLTCVGTMVLPVAGIAAARAQGLPLGEPATSTSLAGRGVAARLPDGEWLVGNRRLLTERGVVVDAETEATSDRLEAEGKTVFFAGREGEVAGLVGVAGTDVAIEAADVALMRDDWSMVPEAIRIDRQGARAIRLNLGFTAVYNIVGIGLAAVGLLPPVWAAAQSLPDGAIMLNAARLLRAGRRP